MNNIDENLKSEVLTQIINHFAEERELLSQSVQGIEEFVKTYTELKIFLDDFKGKENINVSDNLSNINKELNAMNEIVNSYNSNLSGKYKKLQEDFDQLLKKYQTLETSQKKLTNFVDKIDNFMQVLTKLDLNEMAASLNNNQTKVEKLNALVEKDLKEQIEKNNKNVQSVIISFKQFIEASKKQQTEVNKIAQETKVTNDLLKEMSKSNNINQAVLFELMDKWAEERKRSKK